MIRRKVPSILMSRSNLKTLVRAASSISKDIAVFGRYFRRLSRVQLDVVMTKGSGKISRRSLENWLWNSLNCWFHADAGQRALR